MYKIVEREGWPKTSEPVIHSGAGSHVDRYFANQATEGKILPNGTPVADIQQPMA